MRKLLLKTIVLFLLGMAMLAPSLSASKTQIWYRDQVAVIMYHHIDDMAKSGDTITAKLFTDQLNYLISQGYEFITLRQFKDFLAGSSIPENAVLVTFDDGYESFYNYAYPFLKKMRIPAVNFVVTKDLENPLASYIPSLSKDEIMEMTQDTNFIEAQCHTNAMHSKTASGEALLITHLITNGQKETDAQYKQRILDDTNTCISSLKDLNPGLIDTLAYPYGFYTKEALDTIHQAGIKYAFTIEPKMTTRDVDFMQIPRINAGSPWITPEGLHNSIIRSVVAVNHPFSQVNLKNTVEQLGGKVTEDLKGTLHISFRNKTLTGKINSSKITTPEKTISMTQPIAHKSGQAVISMEDLQNILGVSIIYNPNIQKFTTRITANVAK